MAEVSIPARPSWCDEEAPSEANSLDDAKSSGGSRKRGSGKQNDVHDSFLRLGTFSLLFSSCIACKICGGSIWTNICWASFEG